MIEVKDATIAVGGKTLAEGLSFMAKDGQLTCITGEEGVGKTTLLRTLIGFLPVAQGFVSVDGELLTVDSAQAFRSLMIYLPQEMRLLAHQLNQPSWPESEADEYAVWNQLLPRSCQQEQPEPLAPQEIFRLVEKTLNEGRDRRIIIADEPAACRKPQMIEYADQVIEMKSEK